jgi:hypothetical protein
MAPNNNERLFALLDRWKKQDELGSRPEMSGREQLIHRAKLYLAKVPPAVSGQHGHDATFHVACCLVKGFDLTCAEAWTAIQDWNRTCQPPWDEKDLRRKLDQANKAPDEKPRGWLAGSTPEVNGTYRLNADTSNDPLDRDATARDLIEANATIRWGWNRWLPSGVLTVLASEPGVGKTRFCADLARRVYLGLQWPDQAEATFPVGARTLWVPADNQHAELGTLPTAFGFPPEELFLNATRRNPFAGTLLDDPEDLREFERRIHRVKPALVFVDTTLNATDRSSHKPEDAKAFFVPLQQIAARTGVVLICVTHLNAAGKPLGRRIMGQARVVMQLEHPDPEGQPNRRKLYVVKSNSLFPAALGVTMGDSGNEYDTSPPEASAEDETPRSKRGGARLKEAAAWLAEWLKDGPKRVLYTRQEAEAKGFDGKLLYRARDYLEVAETKDAQNKTWWQLTENSV